MGHQHVNMNIERHESFLRMFWNVFETVLAPQLRIQMLQ